METFYNRGRWSGSSRSNINSGGISLSGGNIPKQNNNNRKQHFYNHNNKDKHRKIIGRTKGSSTVFLTLILLLVASLLFTLLESAWVSSLQASAQFSSEAATESVLAEYCIPMMERYHLLALDAGYGSADLNLNAIVKRAEGLLASNSGQAVSAANLQQYQLLTDQGGGAFYEVVTNYMKNNLTREVLESLYKDVWQAETVQDSAGSLDDKRTDALNNIAEAETELVEETSEEGAEVQLPAEKPENPIEYVLKWKNAGILTLVGVDAGSLSTTGIERANCLEVRQKSSGNFTKEKDQTEWYEQALFQEYLMKYFGTYTSPKENTALNYELEYMIAGKTSDQENLADVATTLLAIREAANFVYLQTDQVKCNEARVLATMLVGFTGNTILIIGVQQGILAAWAFAESVSDVKSLLAGERIPIIKTAAQWSSNVTKLSENQTFAKARKCELGLSYEDYLRILLYAVSKEKQSYRAMDLIEQNLHLSEGYDQLRMDCMIGAIKMQYTYTAKPVFLSLVTIGNVSVKGYEIRMEQEMSYLEK